MNGTVEQGAFASCGVTGGVQQKVDAAEGFCLAVVNWKCPQTFEGIAGFLLDRCGAFCQGVCVCICNVHWLAGLECLRHGMFIRVQWTCRDHILKSTLY